MTSQHAIYSPSSAHRWTNCPASATAIAMLPAQEEGDAAKEGTEAHEELERVLNGGAPDPEHPAAYCVALAINYVKQLPPGKQWVEKRVELTKDIWGRCDFAHFDEASGTLTILDLKNGYIDVQAERNEQLMIYAAASIYTHNLPVKWVRLVVVQPNSFMPVPRVKQWVTTADDLFAFAQTIAKIPAGTLTFKAGEHCRYCPAFGKCEATKDLLANLQVMIQHSPSELRADQIALVKACEKPISDWFKSLDKEWTKRALTGTVPAGMKLVKAQKHKVWNDESAARDKIAAELGVQALEPPTPTQAEKLGMDATWIASNSNRPDGGPALAFENDKRPVWEAKSVEKMFQGVTGK